MWILCRVIDYCEIWRVWWVAFTQSVWIHNKQSVYYVNGSVGERECLTTIDKRKSTRDSFYNIILYMFFFVINSVQWKTATTTITTEKSILKYCMYVFLWKSEWWKCFVARFFAFNRLFQYCESQLNSVLKLLGTRKRSAGNVRNVPNINTIYIRLVAVSEKKEKN